MNISLNKFEEKYSGWRFFLEKIRYGIDTKSLRNYALEKNVHYVDETKSHDFDGNWNYFLDTLEKQEFINKTNRTGSVSFPAGGLLIIRLNGTTSLADSILDDYYEDSSSNPKIISHGGVQQVAIGNNNNQEITLHETVESSISKLLEENAEKYGNVEIERFLKEALESTGEKQKSSLLKAQEVASKMKKQVPKIVSFIANISQIIATFLP